MNELTIEALEKSLGDLKIELEKNYSTKLEAEVEKLKASIEVEKRNIETPADNEASKELSMVNEKIKDLHTRKIGDFTFNKNLVMKATNSQLSAGAGLSLVPQQYGEFIDSLNDAGYIRANAKIVPMTSNILNMPYVSTSISLSGTTELDAVSQTNPVIGNIQLTAITDIALVPFSNQLRENSAYDFAGEVLKEATIQADIKQDALFVTRVNALGAGSKVSLTAGGFSSANTLKQSLTSSTVVAGVFGSIFAKLATNNTQYANNASLVMHSSTLWDLAGIADTNNGRDIITFVGAQPYWKGVRIFASNRMTADTAAVSGGGTFIAACNLSDAVILGDRQTMNVRLFEEGNVAGTSLLSTNASAYRVIQEYDVQLKSGRVVYVG